MKFVGKRFSQFGTIVLICVFVMAPFSCAAGSAVSSNGASQTMISSAVNLNGNVDLNGNGICGKSLLDGAQKCYGLSRYEDAAHWAEAARLAFQKEDPFALDTAELESAYYLQALCLQRMHKNLEAIPLFETGLKIAVCEKRLYDTHWLEMLANAYLDTANYVAAVQTLERAFDVVDASENLDTAYEGFLLRRIAETAERGRDWRKAEAVWKKAVRLAERSLASERQHLSACDDATKCVPKEGPKNSDNGDIPLEVSDLADALCGLGRNLSQQERFPEAQLILKRAVVLIETYLPFDSLSAKVRTYRAYADLLRQMKQEKSAIEFSRKATRAERLQARAGW